MANRNRITMNTLLFRSLIQYVELADQVFLHRDEARWIKRKDDADAELMAHADRCGLLRVTRQIRGVHIEHEGIRYFTVMGLPSIDALPNGLTRQELTPGLFAIAVCESNLPPSASPLKIKQAIEATHRGESDFDGIDLEQIQALYPDIFVYVGDNNFEYTSSLVRVLGTLLSTSYFDGPIEFEMTTLAELQLLFESGSDHIPFDNILQGILSISWGGLFLELYRSVEQLFAVPKLISVTEVWPATVPFSKLAELLESRIAWRPKENEALSLIIRACSDDVRNSLSDAFCKRRVPPIDHQNMADDVYRLRNSLVHFRQSLREEELTDQQWNEIARAMTKFVREVYDLYGERYHKVSGELARAG